MGLHPRRWCRWLLRNDGTGVFVADTTTSAAADGSPLSLATADFDGDGDLDGVCGNNTNRISVFA